VQNGERQMKDETSDKAPIAGEVGLAPDISQKLLDDVKQSCQPTPGHLATEVLGQWAEGAIVGGTMGSKFSYPGLIAGAALGTYFGIEHGFETVVNESKACQLDKLIQLNLSK
jgi:hypothetical protein